MCDPRLKLLSEIYNFFKAWESEHLQGDEKKTQQKFNNDGDKRRY